MKPIFLHSNHPQFTDFMDTATQVQALLGMSKWLQGPSPNRNVLSSASSPDSGDDLPVQSTAGQAESDKLLEEFMRNDLDGKRAVFKRDFLVMLRKYIRLAYLIQLLSNTVIRTTQYLSDLLEQNYCSVDRIA